MNIKKNSFLILLLIISSIFFYVRNYKIKEGKRGKRWKRKANKGWRKFKKQARKQAKKRLGRKAYRKITRGTARTATRMFTGVSRKTKRKARRKRKRLYKVADRLCQLKDTICPPGGNLELIKTNCNRAVTTLKNHCRKYRGILKGYKCKKRTWRDLRKRVNDNAVVNTYTNDTCSWATSSPRILHNLGSNLQIYGNENPLNPGNPSMKITGKYSTYGITSDIGTPYLQVEFTYYPGPEIIYLTERIDLEPTDVVRTFEEYVNLDTNKDYTVRVTNKNTGNKTANYGINLEEFQVEDPATT